MAGPSIWLRDQSQGNVRQGCTVTKPTALKILNPVLALLVLVQISTGLFHSSIPHEMFELLHEFNGLILFTGIVLHWILNGRWIRTTYFRGKS